MSNRRPQDQFVNVGNIRTRYWAVGDGRSTAILIHGLGGYVENWEENIEALAMSRRVYALDLVGFGRSDKPRIPYSIPYLTEFLQQFMNIQGIDKVNLIGESLGGAITLQFALHCPQQVEKLVLSDSAGLGREGSLFLRAMSLPVFGELFGRPSREGTEKFLKMLFQNQDLITDEWIDEEFEMSSVPGAQWSLLKTLRSIGNIWGVRSAIYRPIIDRLEEIQAPTLILWGAQDQILPVAHAHKAVKRLPNATLHIFNPCGHIPNIECPEEFNALVNDFLSDK
jgi:pimeloyl-ACP methyl ester carboxylesterase